MRYIENIYTARLGSSIDNQALLGVCEPFIDQLPLNTEKLDELRSYVKFCLVGQRSRDVFVPDLAKLKSFTDRATLFEEAANCAIESLANQIVNNSPTNDNPFEAVITTTSTGNLMPGLSYRMAAKLPALIPPHCIMIDLGNVGCTGSAIALSLARSLHKEIRRILIVALEVPSTLVDLTSTDPSVWQGNCTFGDGAAAVVVTSDPEPATLALCLEHFRFHHQADAGLNLISWAYRDYYTFKLPDERTFNRNVQEFVLKALAEVESGWRSEPRWAIHPAGISLLIRVSRKLGIPRDVIRPSVSHYDQFSNISSVSMFHILKELAPHTPIKSSINLLTMGAGFNVIYGRVRKEF